MDRKHPNYKQFKQEFWIWFDNLPKAKKKAFWGTNMIWPRQIFTLQHGKISMTKIKYIKGDLLQAPEQVILHSCNSLGVMGAGVAKLIREKWPKAYQDYRDSYDSYGLPLGSIVSSKQPDGKIIMNAITQDTIGRSGVHVSYWAIANVIWQLDQQFVARDSKVVAMPAIGSGLAGGDWSVIEAIIENTAKNFQPVVYHL
jgi:O-acetyl-ADP-ribose deacetylase (regulator of RNase III)